MYLPGWRIHVALQEKGQLCGRNKELTRLVNGGYIAILNKVLRYPTSLSLSL
jgi:hypothetical protein